MQSLASYQLGGHENALGKMICDQRGDHEKMDLSDYDVLAQDHEMMTDAGLEGSGSA